MENLPEDEPDQWSILFIEEINTEKEERIGNTGPFLIPPLESFTTSRW
jgi:hypothetical protein